MEAGFVSSFTPGLLGNAQAYRAVSAHPVIVHPMMSLGRGGGRGPLWGSSKHFGRGRSSGDNFGDSGMSGGGSGFFGSGSGGGRGRSDGGAAGGSGGGNVLSSLWAGYNTRLDSNPVLTKAVTSLIGFFLGDLIAQKFLGDKDAPLDKGRLARMASFGALIHGPTGHYFYNFLDSIIAGKTAVKVASKVFIDQVCWAPVFTALFFGYLGVAERKSKDEIVGKIRNDTWKGVQASWKFWPLAHAVNFALIPTNQRLLYINTLQVGYNVILSLLGNK